MATRAAYLVVREPEAAELVTQVTFAPTPEEPPVISQPAPPEVNRPVPDRLIERYALLAAARAVTEQLPDGTWYAEEEALPGVWAEGATEREAVESLQGVVKEWVVLKIRDRDRDIPIIGGIDLNRI